MLLSGQDAELELSGREEAIPSPMTCPLGPSRPPTPRIAAVDSCTKLRHRRNCVSSGARRGAADRVGA